VWIPGVWPSWYEELRLPTREIAWEAGIVAVTGPDFISLQVRDLERSAAFYEQHLGLKRSAAGPPHAVVFGTKPIAFAVRDVVAGVDLDAIAQPGQGMALRSR
jgi:hypothetical protein